MWQEALEPRIAAGEVQAVGVVQEQHPERAALYRQWRGLDWPLYVDALNLLDHEVVPIVLGLDEAGGVVARMRRPSELEAFLARPPVPLPETPTLAPMPHPREGDALFLAGDLDAAIAAYRAAPEGDARARFRLGVALLRRWETGDGRPGDGQAAVDAWSAALGMRPGQYIWRRRLQQYGPTLAKPYNMYGWIEEARAELRARGEQPLPLAVEPRGSELLGRDDGPDGGAMRNFDPDARLPVDEGPAVGLESLVTPPSVRPGSRARVRLLLSPGAKYWNNEAEPLRMHVSAPEGWTLPSGTWSHPQPQAAETRERRVLEFEVEVPADAEAGARELRVAVAYNVCDAVDGVCVLLRQDFRVTVTVDPDAPEIR